MDISAMASDLRSLQQTVSLSIMNRSMKSESAAATMMLEDFQTSQPTKPVQRTLSIGRSNHILDRYA